MMQFNNIKDLKEKNTVLFTCVSCIMVLLVVCYFGINTSLKGTYSTLSCPIGTTEKVNEYDGKSYCVPNEYLSPGEDYYIECSGTGGTCFCLYESAEDDSCNILGSAWEEIPDTDYLTCKASLSACGGSLLDGSNPGITLTPKTETYNGKPIEANKASTISTGNITYTYYTNSSCTTKTTTSHGATATGTAPADAGDYYVVAHVAATSFDSEDSTGCIGHKINKRSVSVSWGTTTSFTYTGSSLGPSATVTTGVTGESMVVNATTAVLVGTHTSTATCSSVSGGRSKCSNYNLTNNTKSFTINEAAPNVETDNIAIFDNALSKTYDGAPINVSAMTKSGRTPSFVYYTNSSCSTKTTTSQGASGSGAAPVDVGTYYVIASVSANANYTAASTSCTEVKILKKDLAVIWGSTTVFKYNGSPQAPTASVNTGVTGETMTVNRTMETNVGSYTSVASCNKVTGGRGKCSNYNLTSKDKNYTIEAKENPPAVEKYTVTYDANGGNLNKTSDTVDAGTKLNLPSPTRSGYTFDGWYTSATGGTKITSPHTVNNNIKIYAHWTKNPVVDDTDEDGNVTDNQQTGGSLFPIILFIGLFAVTYMFTNYRKVR